MLRLILKEAIDYQRLAHQQSSLSQVNYIDHLKEKLRPLANNASASKAAVLVLLTEEPSPKILFTLRSQQLKHHAGEVSFPGGKRDQDDIDDVATALRECHEEVGIKPEDITIIGCLPCIQSKNGEQVRPIVGTVSPTISLSLQPSEIDEAFWVPLSFLLTAKPEKYDVSFGHIQAVVPSFRYHHYIIWGLTARITITMLRIGFHHRQYWPFVYTKPLIKQAIPLAYRKLIKKR